MIGDLMRKSTRHISCAKKCFEQRNVVRRHVMTSGMISLNW